MMRPILRKYAGVWCALAVLGACFGLGGAPIHAAQKNGKDKSDKDQLQGTWVVVTATVGGEQLPEEVAKTVKLTFKGDKATIEILGEAKQGSYTLDPSKKPKTIDVSTDGMNIKGIYEFDGKMLKICSSEGERPTEFKSEAGTQNILVAFKRAEAKKDSEPLQPVSLTAAGGKDKKTDKDLLQGSWSLESGEKGGEKAPEEIVKELKIRFQGDKLIVSLMGKDKETTFKIDPAKKPKTLDFSVDGKDIAAIYELEGNTLKICGSDSTRPAEFKSPAGSDTILLILKRDTKEKSKDTPEEASGRFGVRWPDTALDLTAPRRLAVLPVPALQKDDKKAKNDQELVQGTWQAESAELAGEKIPDELAKSVKLVIKGDKVSASFMGENKEGAFKIDPTKKPKTLDLTVDGTKIEAIYELDGDTLKVCASEGERPKEFKSPSGSKAILLVLKRVKEEKKDGQEEARRRALDAVHLRLAQIAFETAQDKKGGDEKGKDDKADKAKDKSKDKEKSKAKTDLDKLQGIWRVVSMEAGGMKLPVEDLPGGSFRMVIAEDRITILTGEDRNEEGTLKLDEKASPKKIDLMMTRERDSVEGIYKLDGDILTICASGPRGQRPADFKTGDNKEIFLIVMERAAGGKNGDKTKEQEDKLKVARAMTVSASNLKQIGVAIHNYHDTHNQFPLPAIYSKDGKPLLSWRVSILPYIEQDALYNQFKLDEPWDSEHNKKLIAKMPVTYASPLANKQPDGMTFYQVFNGPGALFEGDKKLKLTDVKDGTANTVMVVEAGNAAPWTKPEDLPFDVKGKDLPKLGGIFSNGFYALMCDASVHFVSNRFDATIFRAMVTRANGETVDIERLNLPDKKKTPETKKSDK